MPRTRFSRPPHAAALVAACLATLLLTAACTSASGDGEVLTAGEAPAHLEPVEGTDLSRITLTERGAERLGVTTAAVGVADAAVGTTVIPYAALLYDAAGATWAYTSPEPLVFVRAPVTVTSIDGDRVVLSAGPPAGTEVVTVGAAELFGEELDVGH